MYAVYAVSFVAALFVARKLSFALTHFKVKQFVSAPSMLESLPSVSVCIPARNETHAMTQCLERVVASTYPKMEIIVLDDSSVDNTSILIKSFAHAGVRFVEGSPLPEGWLGKNHAQEGLLRQASGTYVLFMDVDTYIAPHTIEQLMSYAIQEDAAMVSVLPRRSDAWRLSTLFASLRHFWEVMLHTRSSPAVASNAWMVQRRVLLDEFHGFEPHRLNVQPEAQVASVLSKQNRYRFLISTPLLGVAFEKKWSSQLETGVRLLYPMIGGRLVPAACVLLVLVSVIVTMTSVPVLLVGSLYVHAIVAGVLSLLWLGLYATYVSHVWARWWVLGALVWPVICIQECGILVVSMFQYGRHAVTWKGRPIAARARTVAE